MATKLTPKESGGEKPAAGKAPPKEATASKKAGQNGRTASAKAGTAPRAKTTRRSRKDTGVNTETAKVLRDADAGKGLLHYPSLEAMFEDLGI